MNFKLELNDGKKSNNNNNLIMRTYRTGNDDSVFLVLVARSCYCCTMQTRRIKMIKRVIRYSGAATIISSRMAGASRYMPRVKGALYARCIIKYGFRYTRTDAKKTIINVIILQQSVCVHINDVLVCLLKNDF